MKALSSASLIFAFIAFAAFFGNVALGAARKGAFLGDVGEMLTLLAAASLFVIGALAAETARENQKTEGRSDHETD